MKEVSLADYVPLWRTLHADGVTAIVTPALDYVGALELGMLDARFAGEQGIATVGEALRSFIGSIDDQATLHLLYRVDSDVEEDIRAYESNLASGGPPALRAFVAARAEWLRTQKLRRARCYLFFGPKLDSTGAVRGVLGGKLLFAPLSKLSAEVHARNLKALSTLRNALVTRLRQANIHARELSVGDVHGIYHALLNPSHAAQRIGAPMVAVRDTLWSEAEVRAHGAHLREYTEAEQLLAEDIVEERGCFRQESIWRRALTLRVLPEAGTHYFAAESLLSLSAQEDGGGSSPFPYWLSVTINVLPQGRARFRLNAEHGLVDALRNAVPFLADHSVAKQAEDAAKQGGIHALFAELAAMSSKLVSLSVSLLLEAPSRDLLEERTEAARSAFAGAGNSELLQEEVTQLPAFLSMLPGSGPYQLRRKTVTSRNAADFLPVFAPWRGTAKAPSLLFTPGWDAFRLDLFDKHLAPAHHGLVAAMTGSGKSVSLGALTLDALASGVDAILVDNGGSWEPLTRLLGGVHIPVDIKTPLTPFRPWAEMLGEDGALDPESIQEVVGYLDLCIKEEGARGFDKLTVQLVSTAIRHVYERRFRQAPQERPLMSAFRDAIRDEGFAAPHADDRAIAENISRRLGLFVGDSLYGPFLDRPSELRFDARLLTFDMASVSKSPITRSIAMATVMQSIVARAAKRPRRTLVEIDEGHVYLGQDETAEKFLERFYRVGRKFDISMWMISQSFADFTNSKSGEAIINNSALKIFLRHSSGHDAIADYFHLSHRALDAFRGLSMRSGHYSDFFLMYGDRQTTVRLALHPLAYWILTTDADDKRLIDQAATLNPLLDRLAILEQLARRYPHGAPKGRSQQAA